MPKPSRKTNKKVPAIFIEKLVVGYDDLVVIDKISFSIKKGSITALIGPNGSGKTTMMKSILGLIPTKEGTVELFGKPLKDVRGEIGYVPQRFEFDRDFPITVDEFLRLAGPKVSKKKIQTKLKDVGLPLSSLKKRVGTLSGGQFQRLLIAQAILNDPTLLFLDEPSTGIDVAGEEAFYQVIQHLNKVHDTTVLMVSHDITAISAVVDNVICVNKKLLCVGPPSKALTRKTLEGLYGGGVSVYEHHAHK